nr:deoxyribonuclease IV [Clostridia bacterium]
MLNIGCHLSASKGFENMGLEALKINANTFQFFTRNPRGGNAKDINEKDVNKLLDIMNKNNFAKILAHAPYTLNLCSADHKIRKFAKDVMIDDLNRMEYLPGNMYNFHPGSHVGQGVNVGIEYIANALNEILNKKQSTIVLLETMAGKGSEVGSKFEELKEIISKVKLNEKLGVCLDTCHVSDAGFDIVNNLDGVLEEFDNIIGLDRLKAIHLNDSMNKLGAHKDRHQKIGYGYIGVKAFEKIINHPKLRNLPFYLETPQEDISGYGREIKILRKLYKE